MSGFTAVLVGGEELYMAHDPILCVGRNCSVHNPSGHHMSEWVQHWRSDRKYIERVCPHGIGHPDPDDVIYNWNTWRRDITVHGCDGCCALPQPLRLSRSEFTTEVE